MPDIQFISGINYLHVLGAGVVYWILGAIWYMALFSKPWAAGVEKWGLKMGEKPDSSTMVKKMVISFLCNLAGAFIIAWFMHSMAAYNAVVGAKIGFMGGLLAVMAFSTGDNWLNKPLSTFLVDATYHIAGLTLCGVIIGTWH